MTDEDNASLTVLEARKPGCPGDFFQEDIVRGILSRGYCPEDFVLEPHFNLTLQINFATFLKIRAHIIMVKKDRSEVTILGPS